MGRFLDLAKDAASMPLIEEPPLDRRLAVLIELVASFYLTPPEELVVMKRIAAADPASAWTCMTAEIQDWERNRAG